MEATNENAMASAQETPAESTQPPKRDATPSMALWSTAHDYYQAAVLVSKHEPRVLRYSMVDFYLVCHSVEVSLKGLLRAKGWRIEDIIEKIGHDLDKALVAARKEGLEELCPLSPEFTRDLLSANVFYKEKDFEYLASGVMRGMPRTTRVLLDGAATLLSGLHDVCLENIKRHYGKDSAYDPFNAPKRKEKSQR